MITTNRVGSILELVIEHPPVNAMSAPVRERLAAALAAARADKGISAVLIRGEGTGFSGGADVKEFDRALVDPRLPAICDEIEAMEKVVVVAIHGFALGGGLELALACHFRLATPDARLALPEITLGVIPGAGGTQRLPRLVGIERAFEMILSGQPISGTEAAAAGLVDALAEPEELRAAALAFTRKVRQPRRTGQLKIDDQPDLIALCADRHAHAIAERDAARACVTSLRNAVTKPLRTGLAEENALSRQLVSGAQARALRHIFFAERGARKIDDMPAATQPRPVNNIGIIGAGTMGCGIAMTFLSAGMPVMIVETSTAALDRGVETMRLACAGGAGSGRTTPSQADGAARLLHPTLEFDALRRCDLVIEAAYEDIHVKKDLFRRLDGVARPGALLASTTACFDIDEIAAATGRPADVFGMHYFSPANIVKLVEVVRGTKTASDVLLTAVEIGRRTGKFPVVSRACPGSIGNRMMTPWQTHAERLVSEGVDPHRVDRILTGFGLSTGPFQMGGVATREVGDDEIIARTLYVMINEGLKILEEGIAQRSSDIDTVCVHGHGWLRHTGGPMFWAQQFGLERIGKMLRHYRERLGTDFVPAQALGA